MGKMNVNDSFPDVCNMRGTGVADTDAMSEGFSDYFTNIGHIW